MHLCEVAMKGEPLPAQLPVRCRGLELLLMMLIIMLIMLILLQMLTLVLTPSLVPPSMRRAAKDAGVIGTPGSQSSGVHSPASFEVHRHSSSLLLPPPSSLLPPPHHHILLHSIRLQ